MSNSRWGSLSVGILLLLINLLPQSTASETAPAFAAILRKYGRGRRNTVGSKPCLKYAGERSRNDYLERRKLFAQEAPTPFDGESSFPHLLVELLQLEFLVLHRVVSHRVACCPRTVFPTAVCDSRNPSASSHSHILLLSAIILSYNEHT